MLEYFQSAFPRIVLRGIFGVIALIFAMQGRAEESLITNPPFKPVVERASSRSYEKNISTQGSINQQYELASVLGIGGDMKFSIHNKKTNKPIWIGLGETEEGIRVESYDPEKVGVVVSQGGDRELLILRDMKQNSNARASIPAYNAIAPVQNYPKPPPSLPEPGKLLEQIRKKRE